MRSSACFFLQGLSGAGRPLKYHLPCNSTTAPSSLNYMHSTPQLSSAMQPCASSRSGLGTGTEHGGLRGHGRFSSSLASIAALRFGEGHREVARIPSGDGSLNSNELAGSIKQRALRASGTGDRPLSSREGDPSGPSGGAWNVEAWQGEVGYNPNPWDSNSPFNDEVPHIVSETIYGLARVLAVLKARTREVYGLYVQEGLEENLGARGKSGKALWILSECDRRGIAKHETSKQDMNLLSGNGPHQGFVLDASPLFKEPKPWKREK